MPAIALWFCWLISQGATSPPEATRWISSLPIETSAEVDQTVRRHIFQGDLPGAVVLVGQHGKILFHKAYGLRSVRPAAEPMTIDTIFDLASLTKVVATAPAVMLLVERGKLRLGDRVSQYLPAFGQRRKEGITVQQLLVHYSGLPADLRLSRRYRTSTRVLLDRIYQTRLIAPPGERFVYSDLGFVVLGKLVEKISGQRLDEFVRRNIYEPLGMRNTVFLPTRSQVGMIAPTERTRDGGMIRGVVHDPLAAKLGGIAGDAGLFSNAQDLGRFCQMMLNEGSLDGIQILKPETVALMTAPQSPAGKANIRGLGWDMESVYSSARGSFFSGSSYGHTGFTGTSIWIDPVSSTFLVILSNRVHPSGKGNVKELRTELANIVGKAMQVSTDVLGE